MEDPEFIVVCIDNSSQAYCDHNFRPQLDVIKYYCKAKLDANPKTEVLLFTMGVEKLGFDILCPTSDFQEIQDFLGRMFNYPVHRMGFGSVMDRTLRYFFNCPPNMQKRMLFLAGGFVDLYGKNAVKYGSKLKGLGIAVDVVNFYLEEMPKNASNSKLLDLIFEGGLKSTWMELDAFVDAANSNGNSHIEHVQPRSSIPEVLCKSILRKTTPCLSTKTNRHKKATHAAGDNKRVRSEVKLGKRKREEIYLENEGAKLGKMKREAIYA